ncbi:MAG: c-type cytochrome [Chlorobiaceae bacterium]|nr:c-type cytochrome [Chlorobiaceae bacterium]
MRIYPFTLLLGIWLMASNIAQADDEYELADSRGCLACHQLDMKIVGPSFKEIARKYSGNNGAESILEDKVINGGVGVWGNMPMHAGNIDKEEAATLVKWILGTK